MPAINDNLGVTVITDAQSANTVYAGPSVSPSAVPTFRALVAADIPVVSVSSVPNLDASKITSGALPVARGGLGGGLSSINDGDLIRGINGSPANTFQAIAHPGTSTRKFLFGKVTLGISGFGYDQILTTDLVSGFTLPVSKGGTALTTISDGDLIRGVSGSPENTFQAIANPGTGTRLFLSTKTTLGVIGFTYVQITFADHSDFTNWTTFTPTLTAATGTWSGGIVTARYMIEGKKMTVVFFQQNGTISNNTASLTMLIPASKTANTASYGFMQFQDGGGLGSGSVSTTVSSANLVLYRGPVGTSSWTAAAGNSYVAFVFVFEIA